MKKLLFIAGAIVTLNACTSDQIEEENLSQENLQKKNEVFGKPSEEKKEGSSAKVASDTIIIKNLQPINSSSGGDPSDDTGSDPGTNDDNEGGDPKDLPIPPRR